MLASKDLRPYSHFDSQFLAAFSRHCRLWRFPRFDFAAGKFPQIAARPSGNPPLDEDRLSSSNQCCGDVDMQGLYEPRERSAKSELKLVNT